MTKLAGDVPEDAIDLVRLLTGLARGARDTGWRVNIAMETGDAESVTFSASRDKPQNGADEG